MKFKHGMIVGFVAGFITVCTGIAAREVQQESRLKAERLSFEAGKFQMGWADGIKWFNDFHKQNHPECGRCPH